jgi:hypothetical protein
MVDREGSRCGESSSFGCFAKRSVIVWVVGGAVEAQRFFPELDCLWSLFPGSLPLGLQQHAAGRDIALLRPTLSRVKGLHQTAILFGRHQWTHHRLPIATSPHAPRFVRLAIRASAPIVAQSGANIVLRACEQNVCCGKLPRLFAVFSIHSWKAPLARATPGPAPKRCVRCIRGSEVGCLPSRVTRLNLPGVPRLGSPSAHSDSRVPAALLNSQNHEWG